MDQKRCDLCDKYSGITKKGVRLHLHRTHKVEYSQIYTSEIDPSKCEVYPINYEKDDCGLCSPRYYGKNIYDDEDLESHLTYVHKADYEKIKRKEEISLIIESLDDDIFNAAQILVLMKDYQYQEFINNEWC